MSIEELNHPIDAEQSVEVIEATLDSKLELVETAADVSTELLTTSDVTSITQLSLFIETGGPIVVILIVMSVIGLAVLLLKLWQFFYLRLWHTCFITPALNAWRAQNFSEMHSILQKTRNPIARVVERATEVCADKTIDQNLAREEVLRVASLHLADVRSYLRVIEVIAALSPLLGLFGTVLGMIEAFQQLEEAGANVDPAILSGGIWEALLTTAVGLAVAIPAIIALNWLEQKIENFKLTMEDAMTLVFTSNVKVI